MAYTTETMDRILTSPEARKLVSMVAPIYGDSETALWLFQAIGCTLDDILAYIDEFQLQIFPQTATWGLEVWERVWEIVPDPTLSLERRRANILNKKRKCGSMNPARLENILAALAGCTVRIKETPGSNLIQAYFHSIPPDISWQAVLREMNRAKPAHLFAEYSVHEGPLSLHEPPGNPIFHRFKLALTFSNTRGGRSVVRFDGSALFDGSILFDQQPSGVEMPSFKVRFAIAHTEKLRGAVTIDDGRTFDGSTYFDGTYRFNAGITREEL